MSRFPLKFTAPVSLLALAGCMYPPMYQQQPYGQQAPYGQQMYAPQGNFAPSGTMVVPPSNAPLYQPGGSTYSTPGTPLQTDDFNKPSGSSDPRFFGPNDQVPLPSDPAAGTGSGSRPFSNDLDLSK
jgi:hypothetical protein